MNRTSRRNKDIAIAMLRGATYLRVAIEYDITWRRAFQITHKLSLHVEPTSKQDIKAFRNRANEIILKIDEAPGSPRYIWKQGRHLQ